MSIFASLRNAILGSASHTATPTPIKPSAPAAPAAARAPAPPTSTAGAPAASGAPSAGSPADPVDIEAVLSARAAKKPEKLNWESSIVDLMKLVDLDPSLENRKELAAELGYQGDTKDSATMNTWLHREVMQKLAAAGGKVPESLRH
jgi:3-oxoacyl-ACP reductase-like protein